MNNDIKTIVSINDDYISLLVFRRDNNVPLILYEKSYSVNECLIKNGYIIDKQEVTSVIGKLINEAKNFTGFNIKSVHVNLDAPQLKIKPFESERVRVPNGILDKVVWENDILKNWKTSQEADRHIYKLSVLEWIINGQSHYSLDSQYQTNFVDVKGNTFQINNVIWNMYVEIFKNLNIELKEFIPYINCFSNFVKSNRNSNYELFVTMNSKGLGITLTKGNNIINFNSVETFGFDNLFVSIHKETKLPINQIKQFTNLLPELYSSTDDLIVGNKYTDKYLQIHTIMSSDIKTYIQNFASKIADFIDRNIIYFAQKKNIDISLLTFVPTNPLSSIIFNIIKAFINSNNTLLDEYSNLRLGVYYNQAIVHAKSILMESKDDIFIDVIKNKLNRTRNGILRKGQ